MNTKILTTVSVIALMVSFPALAETKVKAEGSVQTTNSVQTDVKNAWEDIKKDTSTTYENIKASLIGDEKTDAKASLEIDSRHTANGMIGKPVLNGNNDRIGTVKDIIVDGQGAAHLVVIADGEIPGFDGKLVAFDYSLLTRQNVEGDFIAPINEETLDKATEFSYDTGRSGERVRVIPNNGYSVAKLLEGQLVNEKKDSVADIDNISFRNAKASELIVSFDKVLGLGGEKAAVKYDNARLVRDGSELDFQLSANQSSQFETFKKNMTN
jgi:hypothetical protein